MYYFIDWDSYDYMGYKETTTVGPFPSGTEVTVNHSWYYKGNYTIKVKAIDIIGGESEWATLEVVMPKSQNVYHGWLDKFPILQKILDVLRLNRR